MRQTSSQDDQLTEFCFNPDSYPNKSFILENFSQGDFEAQSSECSSIPLNKSPSSNPVIRESINVENTNEEEAQTWNKDSSSVLSKTIYKQYDPIEENGVTFYYQDNPQHYKKVRK